MSADVRLDIQPDAIGGGSTPGLQSSILNGLAWKVTSQVVLQLSRIAVGIALARLLSPHDYGVAGMVLVFSSLVLVFSDLAFGAALVQRKVLSEADRSTVFWTSAAAGLAFTLIGFALSWPIADFFGEPEVQPLFAALSLSFVIASIGTTQTSLLTRAMSFRALEMRTMASGLVGAAVGLTLAFGGAGAWAIIAQQLTIVAVGTVIIWAATPWRPHFTFSVASLRSLGGFSGNVLGQRLLVLRAPERRQPADRPLPRRLGPRRLRPGLQRHAPADLAASRARCRRSCIPRSRACRATARRWRTRGCGPRASSAP